MSKLELTNEASAMQKDISAIAERGGRTTTVEQLIQKYCPEGVEYRPLGSFSEQFSGMTGVSNKWAEEGNCLFIDYMNVYKHLSVDTSALKYATVKSSNQNTLMTGDILFTSASETPDECALAAVIEDDIQEGVFLDDHLFGIRIIEEYKAHISPSYLKYAFHSDWFRTQVRKVVRGVTRNYVSKVDFMKLEIPVPPLPVQEEIVRILDTFTELQAELQAELQKRKQQYNYYRDNLLSFEGRTDVEWKPISTVAQVCRGVRVVKSQLSNEGYPVFQNCLTPMGFFDKTNCPGGTPFVICGGAAGNVGYSYVDCWAADDCEYIIGGQGMSNRFIYHCLMTKSNLLLSQVRKASIPRLSPTVIKELEIPVPSLSEQQKIVDILDRFDTLTNDLAAGLPAEIEKRRQQYEYYRDKLLTFKRKES